MRNLRLLRNINLQNPEFFVSDRYCIVNVNDCSNSKSTRVQCFVFSGDLKVYRLLIHSNVVEDHHLIANLLDYITPKHELIKIVECTYLFNYLYIVLSDGHFILILFNDEDVETKSYDFDIDVKYVSWSPDINRTAIVDNDNILYIFGFFDDGPSILMKIPLQDESEEQNPSVNVGWGSIETQFRGTEGKFSKSKSTEPTVEESSDDFSVNTCWKQNSTAFAVTYVCKISGIRKVKIFDQDGALLNVTKDVAGLFSPIDWCSSRNLITCVQQLPNKKVICFLEQNALRHGEFQISDYINVLRLSWNNNGSILACHENRKNQSGEIITLWTTSNYKWYQKQCLIFSENISYFQWDFDVPNRLHVILKTGSYRMYEWMFEIDQSRRSDEDANAHLVAVINDKQLNITPYRQVCQPPSMPYTTYSAPISINAVIFPNQQIVGSPGQHSALLFLSDYKCALMTYECPSQDLYYFHFGDDEAEIEFETPLELSTWLWLLPHNLYFNWNRVDGNYFCVSQLDLETKSIVLKNMFKMKGTILAVTNFESDVIVHTEDGSLFLYRDHVFVPMTFSLLEPCFVLQAINHRLLIALGENRNLYINENIKWRDIVSFCWKPPFLVLIKMNSQLLITKTKLNIYSVDIKFSEVQTRQIEPKSYLVTIVDDEVLLETERGNLEVIRPRPFSIFKMEQMLTKPEYYYDVFKMLRKQRINLNVIYDHDPCSFLRNVDQIVRNVTDSMYLSSFIMELVDEDVAKSIFPWKYCDEEFKLETDIENIKNKVNRVCDAMVSAIQKFDTKKLINPLIAALVRQGKLEEASNHAIEYDEIDSLCLLTDPIAVYKATLASYNIVSALRIVEHSKLDPSEYLPFIRELEATEENYRKFKICNYLEKYDEALKYLSECPNKFDECVTYIRKHGLYVNALHIYGVKNSSINPTNPEYVQILTIVADYHFNNRMYEEAGVLYEKSKMYEKAFECYVAVGDCLAVSSMLTLMDGKISEAEAYKTLYEALLKRGQYADAAFIAFHYSKNCKQAVDAFLTAKKYCKALNAAKGLGNEDIIEDTIHPQLLIEVKSTIEHIQSDKKTIEKYIRRLKNAREDMRFFPTLSVEENDSGSSQSSSASTTTKSSDSSSSTSSKSSTSSTNSEKELRRRERMLWNLKVGNRREMPALLAVIKDLLITTEKLYPKQIPDLVKASILTDEIENARSLNAEYSQFLKFLEETRNKVWPANEVKEEGGFKDISIRCPPDGINSNEVLKLLDNK